MGRLYLNIPVYMIDDVIEYMIELIEYIIKYMTKNMVIYLHIQTQLVQISKLRGLGGGV